MTSHSSADAGGLIDRKFQAAIPRAVGLVMAANSHRRFMMISPEALRRYACLASVQDETLKALAMISQEQTFTRGSVLFREREPADYLFIIAEGEVEISYAVGDEHRSVDTLVAGELMLWSALVPPHQTHSTAVARETTRVIAINAPKLRVLCEQDHVLGFRLMSGVAEAVSHRLHGARLQLAAMS